jgi:hypothetical protein
MNTSCKFTLALVSLASICAPALAQKKDMDKEWREMKAFSEKEKAREVKEQMRDKSHDPPRYQTGKDSSIGVDPAKGQVNIRKSYE